MAHRRPVRRRVGVRGRRHRHRLRPVPVLRSEGQRRGAHRHVRAAGHRWRHRHRTGRLRRKHHGISPTFAFGHRQGRRGQLNAARVVIRHCHRDVARSHRAVVSSGHRMRDRRRVVLCVRVLGRRHRHGLGHVPGLRSEGQRRRAHRHVRAAGHGWRHRHRTGRLRRKHHGIGPTFAFGHCHGRRGQLNAARVVIRHCHRNIARSHRAVVSSGHRMRDRRRVVRNRPATSAAVTERSRRPTPHGSPSGPPTPSPSAPGPSSPQ